MSKRKEKIQLGKFYKVEDPSGSAHYGRPYKYHKKTNKYDVVKFTTKKKKSYQLVQNIDCLNLTEDSYVRKRPERVGINYIKKELPLNFCIKNSIDKSIVRHVEKNKIKIRGKNKKK